ncbi:D-arabinono-1,4-lactone oxidase [Dermatobacter hominis]|uniref:D-arabinono-1,4-lactone oxidase n=1 Tax=Dermatobacter hominis TaxID=2884263 RepID=UPI001D10CD18|nr:D-arabinono-1,4-lactone oxidase [Dermatobacter hominis]UDY37246.1 FAD-binding protein [Dermatobacter hominis]
MTTDEGPREGALGASGDAPHGERVRTWSNWAGNQSCRAEVLHPTTEPELCRIVADAAAAGRTVRAFGAGHSFTDVALSDAVLVDLSGYDRILGVDREACTVTVQSGARLHDLSLAMWPRGLAFTNLGDIDVQSIAGATATATHGTGMRFGNISTAVVGLRVIDGLGAVHEVDARTEPDLFAAARASIGALGLVSTVTVQLEPAFHLHAVHEPRRVDEVLERFGELVRDNDHFEFFWVPGTRWSITKRHRRNHEPVAPRSRRDELLQSELYDNVLFGLANRVGRWRPALGREVAKRIPSPGRVEFNDRCYRVFASPRRVRFVEMEYAVPVEATVEAVQRVRAHVASLGYPVSFPVEVRVSRGDDITLSTASGRDTGWIAVHMYRGLPYEEYFRGVESIMRDLDGRPHWGKLHWRTAADLAPAYPGWDDFQELRARMDPLGVFQNAAMTRVLGPLGG